MKTLLVAAWVVLLAPGVGAEDQRGAEVMKKPVKAVIVDARKIEGWSGDPVGNVEVTYEDGTPDRWTKSAAAQMPKVAADGVVGWVDCSVAQGGKQELNVYKGVPVGSRLVLCEKGKITARITAGKAFIEEWGFTTDGKHVVVKSRGAHGPAVIERFTRPAGKPAGSAAGYDENAPAWAEDYLD